MKPNDKKEFIKFVSTVKFPDGYDSNIARCVNVDGRKFTELKSHDCHVFMQRLLPVGIRHILPEDVVKPIYDSCDGSLARRGIACWSGQLSLDVSNIKVNKLKSENFPIYIEELYNLAFSLISAELFSGCHVNGIKFLGTARDDKLCMQNSGVHVPGGGESTDIDFYGKLTTVVQLLYKDRSQIVYLDDPKADNGWKVVQQIDQRNVYAIPELDPSDNDVDVFYQRLESSMENDAQTLLDSNVIQEPFQLERVSSREIPIQSITIDLGNLPRYDPTVGPNNDDDVLMEDEEDEKEEEEDWETEGDDSNSNEDYYGSDDE
ncbi:unnamed protein product [Prunus armeniaca]